MSREERNKGLMEWVEWNNDHSSSNVSFSGLNYFFFIYFFFCSIFCSSILDDVNYQSRPEWTLCVLMVTHWTEVTPSSINHLSRPLLKRCHMASLPLSSHSATLSCSISHLLVSSLPFSSLHLLVSTSFLRLVSPSRCLCLDSARSSSPSLA